MFKGSAFQIVSVNEDNLYNKAYALHSLRVRAELFLVKSICPELVGIAVEVVWRFP